MKIYAKDSCFTEEVIISTLKKRGNGKNDPIRIITQVFTTGGQLIAEHDPIRDPKTFLETWQDATSRQPGLFRVGDRVKLKGVDTTFPGIVLAVSNYANYQVLDVTGLSSHRTIFNSDELEIAPWS